MVCGQAALLLLAATLLWAADEGVYVDVSMMAPDEAGTDADRVHESVALESGGDQAPVVFCVDDTDCARGYRCSAATQECTKIPECLPNSGREHGLKHGECLPCTTDDECGWFTGAAYDFCWPDGACRDVQPYRLFFTRVDAVNRTASVQRVAEGDRVCVSVVPAFREDLFHVDVRRLDLCASTLYFAGADTPVAAGTDRAAAWYQQRGALHAAHLAVTSENQDIQYPGILPLDPDRPGSTGCRTDPDRVRVHTVFRKARAAAAAEPATGGGERAAADEVDGRHHFRPSVLSSVTAGFDTVCFDAKAVTAPRVPIYIEAKVDVTPATSVWEPARADAALSQDEILGLYRVYGLLGDDLEWRGVVSSPRRTAPAPSTIALLDGLSPALSNLPGMGGPAPSSMFVACPLGAKFDGVAGICEQPGVSNDLFFWILIASAIVLVAGAVLFVVQLKSHNEYMMYLIRSGQIVHLRV